ncbi:MAG: phosphoribosyltransferase family protein [Patescibacteria group bacterium]|nr:phosphoribosyltransferase family protein [Patescibacteria group bacterium]
MIYKNRSEAGKALAKEIKTIKKLGECVVVALPRGGVVLGAEIARAMKLPLDIVVPRKIGAPENPEFAAGAIAEDGEFIANPDAGKIEKDYLEKEIEKEKQESSRRLKTYRGDRPVRQFEGKTILLVDDGIATGLTMIAAIRTLRKMGVKKIIICVPVSAQDSYNRINPMVERVICPSVPFLFGAVGQFYREFPQVEDNEVVELMSLVYENRA